MTKILFVCTGNICRSPTAEAVFNHRAKEAGLPFTADSCGTSGYHVGDRPDKRTIAAARARGIAMEQLIARQLRPADYHDFDLLLALDASHLQHLEHHAPAGHGATLALFLKYAGLPHTHEVPDPYYGSRQGFTHVLDLIEEGCDLLLEKLQKAA